MQKATAEAAEELRARTLPFPRPAPSQGHLTTAMGKPAAQRKGREKEKERKEEKAALEGQLPGSAQNPALEAQDWQTTLTRKEQKEAPIHTSRGHTLPVYLPHTVAVKLHPFIPVANQEGLRTNGSRRIFFFLFK